MIIENNDGDYNINWKAALKLHLPQSYSPMHSSHTKDCTAQIQLEKYIFLFLSNTYFNFDIHPTPRNALSVRWFVRSDFLQQWVTRPERPKDEVKKGRRAAS